MTLAVEPEVGSVAWAVGADGRPLTRGLRVCATGEFVIPTHSQTDSRPRGLSAGPATSLVPLSDFDSGRKVLGDQHCVHSGPPASTCLMLFFFFSAAPKSSNLPPGQAPLPLNTKENEK